MVTLWSPGNYFRSTSMVVLFYLFSVKHWRKVAWWIFLDSIFPVPLTLMSFTAESPFRLDINETKLCLVPFKNVVRKSPCSWRYFQEFLLGGATLGRNLFLDSANAGKNSVSIYRIREILEASYFSRTLLFLRHLGRLIQTCNDSCS